MTIQSSIFRRLLFNTLIAGVTNSFVWFVVTFWTYLETKSILATSLIAGIFAVTNGGTALFFGAFVDHNKKKRVMIYSSAGSLIAYTIGIVLYYLFFYDAVIDVRSVVLWVFITILMIGSIIGNLRMIALTTCVTILIPEKDRDKANGLVGTVNGISFAITSFLSGIIIGYLGMHWALLFSIFFTAVALIDLFFISIPEKEIVETSQSTKEKIDLRGTMKLLRKVDGMLLLIFFATFNNLLGGVFMALMDAYGLSLVSVQTWGILWGFLSILFIGGGLLVSKFGVGKNPIRTLILLNGISWLSCVFFTLQPWPWLFVFGTAIWMITNPAIEASEQTIIQKVIPLERQGRVIGFAQSIESAASPLTTLFIGPITHFFFVPFMTTGLGASLIGSWFGTGQDRAIALVFTLSGIIGVLVTIWVYRSSHTKRLVRTYQEASEQ